MTTEKQRNTTLSVEVFGKSYPVSCPDSDIASLHDSVDTLNSFLDKLSANRNQHSRDQLMVLAALNFANRSIEAESQCDSKSREESGRLRALQEKIERKLAK